MSSAITAASSIWPRRTMPTLTERARAAAETLGLAFERRFTGYGDLRPSVESFVARAA